jgi:hypothetical protein
VTKNYYVPKYFRATWLHSKLTCNLYGFDLAALQNLDEVDAVRKMALAFPHLFTQWTHIDGITKSPKSPTEWYFSSGEKISYSIPWYAGEPGFHNNAQWCLAVGQVPKNEFQFVDIECTEKYEEKFICQEITTITVEKDSCKHMTFYQRLTKSPETHIIF